MYCTSLAKVMRVPQAISQLFALLHGRNLDVILIFRRVAICTDEALSLGL